MHRKNYYILEMIHVILYTTKPFSQKIVKIVGLIHYHPLPIAFPSDLLVILIGCC